MHSSWFQKPVYKRVRWLAIFFLAGSFAYTYANPSGWLYVAICLFIWLTFLLVCSFNIRSGAFVRTINSGNKNLKRIFLTFDDGPDDNTLRILDILQYHHATASFFLTGSKAEKSQHIVNRMVENGHCIGNHSYGHKSWFPLLPVRKIKEEITTTQSIIEHITGTPPRYFRPPFGVTNPLIAKALSSFNLITIGWSVRSLDTIIKDPQKLITRIKKQIKPGSIVLLHDSSMSTGKILEEILIFCRENGYNPVTLDEL